MAEIIIRGQIAHVANRHRHQGQAATRAQETRPASAGRAIMCMLLIAALAMIWNLLGH
jgi:hypothetical protein